jgi:hypothetical protein
MEDETPDRVKPTTKETYALLLDKVNDSFIGEVIEVNESDSFVTFKNISSQF